MTDLEKDIQDCKEQQGDSSIPVLSYEMLKSPELKKKYLNGSTVFHVLKRDKEKVNHMY